jgi:SAM-dependent methyltransferase
MDLSTFRTLLTPQGRSALDAAASLHSDEADFLRHFTLLSRTYPYELARSALAVAILRRSGGAVAKFGDDANRLFFEREALEQASSWEVSAWRAKRYEPFDTVVDLGCSIGGDTLPLARRHNTLSNATTIGVDSDRLRIEMAEANARATGVDDGTAFVLADLASSLPLAAGPDMSLFFDPGRRVGERRARSVTQYQPPLEVIQNWLPQWPALGVKLSPAVRTDELTVYDAEVEFISLKGELKEAVLWFGPLRTRGEHRRATVLPGGNTMTGTPDLIGDSSLPPHLSEPLDWLYEPDPAVIRAGLVRTLGAELNAAQLDPTIAFLTSETRVDTPFARSWPIEDWMPFHLKRLRAYLRERGIGKVTVKKRGSPLDAERLAHDLRGRGEAHRLLVLTQLDGKPIVIVCS